MPTDNAVKQHMTQVNARLKTMRFQAREASIENKEALRETHDKKRGPALRTRTARDLKVGDVVALCRPTPTLKKVSFQWTTPDYIVLHVTTATCTV